MSERDRDAAAISHSFADRKLVFGRDRVCDRCGGKGTIVKDREKRQCDRCYGTGVVSKDEQ